MNPRRNGDSLFRVTVLDPAKKQLAAIFRRAAQVGKATEVIAAFRQIHRRLSVNPRVAGEPAGHYVQAMLDYRRVGVAPLFAYYGVHQTEPEVFIREFRDLL